MEGKIAWLIVLSFFMLAQSLFMALKIIKERNAKKNNGRNDKTDNPYGERLATLEEAVENLEKRMDKLEEKIDRMGRK